MCWILGKPDNELIRNIEGPVALKDVPKALGLK
jgi:ribosomal protein S28E/S33